LNPVSDKSESRAIFHGRVPWRTSHTMLSWARGAKLRKGRESFGKLSWRMVIPG
jgi:hypothetical protein